MTTKNIMKISWICWFIALLALIGFVKITYAADATFSWLPNSESDLAGYKIHYGPISRQYETVIDTGLPDTVNGRVSYTISGVPESKTYFSATAYDESGLESDYSDEIIYDPAPGVVHGFSVTTTTTTTTTTTIAQ